MKIGIPKIRLSRKMLLITIGLILALGGSATAALYFTTDVFSEKKEEQKAGATCVDIQTMVLKTPGNHLWLRKYIRMDNVDGMERVRTALRIAGLLAKTNAVDLIHVSVIDSKGPTKRAEMRDRTIGAEVLIAMKPQNLPEMEEPAEARYFEGNASDEGKYYGERVSLDFAEIRDMMTAMRKVPDKQDCAKPEPTEEEKAAEEKKAKEHGEKKKSEHGEKPAEHGEKPAEHGEKPAEHGEKPAEHGADPKEGDAAADAHGAEPAKEKGFLDSMLGMVGLGSDEPPAAEHAAEDGKDHGAETADHASGEDKSADAHATTEEAGKDHGADSHEGEHSTESPAADHGEPQPGAEKADAQATEEAVATEEASKAPEEKGFVDSMLGMVGLGGDDKPEEAAPAEHGDEEPALDEPAKDHSGDEHAAQEDHDAKPTDHSETAAAEHGDEQQDEKASTDHSDAEHAEKQEPAATAAKADHTATDSHGDESVAEESPAEDAQTVKH